jgi:DNA-binding transcriptional ArsR family regulator
MLRALAEPQRLMILRLVRSRELRAGDIARHFKTTRSGISQHLRVLTDAGLLSQRRHGTSRLYRVRREGFAQLRDFLDTFWQDRLGNLKTAAEEIAKKRAL